jgi:hypothetical protein
MRNLLFAAVLAVFLVSCGQSQEEKELTKAVYQEYKDKQIGADMSVPFNILNLSIKSKEQRPDTTIYEVEFDIQEMHPSRRVYYIGHTTIKKVNGSGYNVGILFYRENSRLNR